MTETIYQDGHKVCARGCGRLVYTEHTQFPGVCSDCVQPARRKMLALTDKLLAGELTPDEHNAALAAVTIDDTPTSPSPDDAAGADEATSGRGRR